MKDRFDESARVVGLTFDACSGWWVLATGERQSMSDEDLAAARRALNLIRDARRSRWAVEAAIYRLERRWREAIARCVSTAARLLPGPKKGPTA